MGIIIPQAITAEEPRVQKIRIPKQPPAVEETKTAPAVKSKIRIPKPEIAVNPDFERVKWLKIMKEGRYPGQGLARCQFIHPDGRQCRAEALENEGSVVCQEHRNFKAQVEAELSMLCWDFNPDRYFEPPWLRNLRQEIRKTRVDGQTGCELEEISEAQAQTDLSEKSLYLFQQWKRCQPRPRRNHRNNHNQRIITSRINPQTPQFYRVTSGSLHIPAGDMDAKNLMQAECDCLSAHAEAFKTMNQRADAEETEKEASRRLNSLKAGIKGVILPYQRKALNDAEYELELASKRVKKLVETNISARRDKVEAERQLKALPDLSMDGSAPDMSDILSLKGQTYYAKGWIGDETPKQQKKKKKKKGVSDKEKEVIELRMEAIFRQIAAESSSSSKKTSKKPRIQEVLETKPAPAPAVQAKSKIRIPSPNEINPPKKIRIPLPE